MNKKLRDLINSHGKNTFTRRELVSYGLATAAGSITVPTFAQWLSNDGTSKLHLPVLVLDLAGGAALPANFLVGGQGGPKDLLPSYSDLGWDPQKEKWSEEFGIPMPEQSGFYRALTQSISQNARKNFKMATIAHSGNVDVSNNPFSFLNLALQSGLTGSAIKRPLGTRSSLSGGFSSPAYGEKRFESIYVKTLRDLLNLSSLSEEFDNFSDEKRTFLANTIRNLSKHQAQKFLSSKVDKDTLAQISDQFKQTVDSIGGQASFDPRKDTDAASVYQINQNTNVNSPVLAKSGMILSCVNGYSGGCTITIEGCDYHDGSRTTGDNKDFEAGLELGRAVELAHRKNKPLFIQIITDGGCYAKGGGRGWVGDSVDKCMSVIGFYNPNSQPKYIEDRIQIGHYTSGQGADSSHLVGSGGVYPAAVALLNYLNLKGELSNQDKYLRGLINRSDIDKLLIFES